MALRSALWSLGLRYRKNARDLPGVPDLVFRKAKVAVFVDGDFWHGRDLHRRLRRLRKGHNPDYWVRKILSNVARDKSITGRLEKEGWLVMRFWETDVHGKAPEIADHIGKNIRERIRTLAAMVAITR